MRRWRFGLGEQLVAGDGVWVDRLERLFDAGHGQAVWQQAQLLQDARLVLRAQGGLAK